MNDNSHINTKTKSKNLTSTSSFYFQVNSQLDRVKKVRKHHY